MAVPPRSRAKLALKDVQPRRGVIRRIVVSMPRQARMTCRVSALWSIRAHAGMDLRFPDLSPHKMAEENAMIVPIRLHVLRYTGIADDERHQRVPAKGDDDRFVPDRQNRGLWLSRTGQEIGGRRPLAPLGSLALIDPVMRGGSLGLS